MNGKGNCISGEGNLVFGEGNTVTTNLSAEDQQAMMANMQDMIMARLQQRFVGY